MLEASASTLLTLGMVTILAQSRKMHSTKLDVFSTTCLEETHLCRWLLDIALSINVGCDIHEGMVTIRARCRKRGELCGFSLSSEHRLLVMPPGSKVFARGGIFASLPAGAKGLDQWTVTSCIHWLRWRMLLEQVA